MQILSIVCWMLLLFPGDSTASSVRKLQEDIVKLHSAVDEFSASYHVVANEIYENEPTICMGSVSYRYSRSKKKMAIGLESVPILIVEGHRALIFLWENEDESKTYLKLSKSHEIGWKDIDDALQLIRKESPLAGPPSYFPFPALPFLDGGDEQLFSKKMKILSRHDPGAEANFVAGHPDSKPMMVLEPEETKLDPHKFPHCITTESPTSNWTVALDRETGLVNCAVGVVSRMRTFGVPGNNVDIALKRVVTYDAGQEDVLEFPEVPLELPKNARTITPELLKFAYYEKMMKGGLKKLVSRMKSVDIELQSIVEMENNLMKRIAERKVNSTDAGQLKKLQLTLEKTRGKRKSVSSLKAALQQLIDEFRQKNEDRGS